LTADNDFIAAGDGIRTRDLQLGNLLWRIKQNQVYSSKLNRDKGLMAFQRKPFLCCLMLFYVVPLENR
jgi:hypothetical protein